MVWIVGSALLHSGLYGQLLITIWNIHLFYGSFIDGHYCYEVKISSENTKIISLWSGLTCPPIIGYTNVIHPYCSYILAD